MGYTQNKPKLITPLEKKMYNVIVTLIEEYIANFGTDGGEFVICKTPKGIPSYWENAIKVIGLKRTKE